MTASVHSSSSSLSLHSASSSSPLGGRRDLRAAPGAARLPTLEAGRYSYGRARGDRTTTEQGEMELLVLLCSAIAKLLISIWWPVGGGIESLCNCKSVLSGWKVVKRGRETDSRCPPLMRARAHGELDTEREGMSFCSGTVEDGVEMLTLEAIESRWHG